MNTYSFSVLHAGIRKSGTIEAVNTDEATDLVRRMYALSSDVNIDNSEKTNVVADVAKTAAVGAGCLGVAAIQILMAAVPVLVALWLFKSCS